MKIVHALAWYFPEALGGAEIYVNGLAQRLKRRGHDVSVTAPSRGDGETREYEHEGIPVFRYPLRGRSATRDECQSRVSAAAARFCSRACLSNVLTFCMSMPCRRASLSMRSRRREPWEFESL